MPWYRAGTVSVTQNSNAVIGTGTAFIANSRVGDGFRGPDGAWYEVSNIASDTAMSISPSYQGATNSAGGFAIAPLQGYVKDSADALRSLVNQFGEKLAALRTTGNYDTLPISKGGTSATTDAEARNNLGLGSVAVESVVPIIKGGTGANTEASLVTKLKSLGFFDRTGSLGLVSQSSGFPTGALQERGFNDNGEFEKYACGTMICRKVASSVTGVGVNQQRGALYGSQDLGPDQFPVNFAGAPWVGGLVYSPGNRGWMEFVEYATNTGWPKWTIYSPYSSQWANLIINFVAIGRWY